MESKYLGFLFSVVICIAFGMTGCSGTQEGMTEDGVRASAGEYQVGIGDTLEINVWREPMLSGETVVRSDGMISITLIGDVKAVGRTPMELKEEIQQKLTQYVAEPAVTVIVKAPTSQKFYVIGEVRAPGEYELIKDMTVVQAISRAGGFSEWAAKDKILLLRKENGVEKRLRINYKDVVKGRDGSQNVQMRANDTIVVP